MTLSTMKSREAVGWKAFVSAEFDLITGRENFGQNIEIDNKNSQLLFNFLVDYVLCFLKWLSR